MQCFDLWLKLVILLNVLNTMVGFNGYTSVPDFDLGQLIQTICSSRHTGPLKSRGVNKSNLVELFQNSIPTRITFRGDRNERAKQIRLFIA